jgi:hypothetical protein
MSKIFVPKRRVRTLDILTYDAVNTIDSSGNALGRRLQNAVTTHDGRTVDSTGSFMVGELERLDLTLHQPLAAVTWSRDIDLREDVTIADEISAFTQSSFASAGGLGTGNAIGNGKAWIGKSTDQVTGISVDIAKTPQPLRPWGMELKYTVLELESSARLGRPIDDQKFQALQLKYQMDIDEQVYIGDSTTGDKGLLNASVVTAQNLPNGASASPRWSTKTPDEILADVNNALTTTWANSGWAQMPSRLLLPPAQFGYISTAKVSSAGNVSILKYILENNILSTSGMGKLEIFPVKWLLGSGAGGTVGTSGTVDRMVVYMKAKDRVRYPLTMLQRTPLQFDSIYQKTTYFCRLGVVEWVYPETAGFFDGL